MIYWIWSWVKPCLPKIHMLEVLRWLGWNEVIRGGALIPYGECPYRCAHREKATCRRRQRGGWCMNKTRNIRGGQHPPRSEDEKDGTDSEGTNPAEDTVILDFRSPELRSNTLLLSKPPDVQSFVWGAQKTHTAVPYVWYVAAGVTPSLTEPPLQLPTYDSPWLTPKETMAQQDGVTWHPQLPRAGAEIHSHVRSSKDHAANPLAGLPLLILGVASFTPQWGASPRST